VHAVTVGHEDGDKVRALIIDQARGKKLVVTLEESVVTGRIG
jgi:hypothetical protein